MKLFQSIKIDKRLDRISRIAIKALRHDPKSIGITIDKYGWASVDKILSKLNITLDELKLIVELNDKERFAFSDDITKIRASQGHSIDVDLSLPEVQPLVLYHGTSYDVLPLIKKEGIIKGKRQHVHLSDNVELATKVGSRHGKPIVLTIDTQSMIKDGLKIYISHNGVYLTHFIDTKYIKF